MKYFRAYNKWNSFGIGDLSCPMARVPALLPALRQTGKALSPLIHQCGRQSRFPPTTRTKMQNPRSATEVATRRCPNDRGFAGIRRHRKSSNDRPIGVSFSLRGICHGLCCQSSDNTQEIEKKSFNFILPKTVDRPKTTCNSVPMLQLDTLLTTPPGGWFVTVPETETLLEAGDFMTLQTALRQHYRSNHIEHTDYEVSTILQDLICQRLDEDARAVWCNDGTPKIKTRQVIYEQPKTKVATPVAAEDAPKSNNCGKPRCGGGKKR